MYTCFVSYKGISGQTSCQNFSISHHALGLTVRKRVEWGVLQKLNATVRVWCFLRDKFNILKVEGMYWGLDQCANLWVETFYWTCYESNFSLLRYCFFLWNVIYVKVYLKLKSLLGWIMFVFWWTVMQGILFSFILWASAEILHLRFL